MFDGEYIEFNKNRIESIINYYGEGWFKNKKILELGCGYADIGYAFYQLGAVLTVNDAREEHLDIVRKRYPFFKVVKCDLDKDWNFDDYYDFMIHAGILYHLKNYEQNLINCFKNCDNMFLEANVSDSNDENFVFYLSESGYDQSFNGIGSRPSEKNIEKIIIDNGLKFERWFKKELNTEKNIFDWEIKNTKNNRLEPYNLRRSWFIKKTK